MEQPKAQQTAQKAAGVCLLLFGVWWGSVSLQARLYQALAVSPSHVFLSFLVAWDIQVFVILAQLLHTNQLATR
jgi:cytosine/uracil/thiamine/allantoin permease